MALHFDYSEVKPYQNMFIKREDGEYHGALLEAMIWATMSVGIGRITEKNAAEFYARLALLRKIDGAPEITPEQVRWHIGLRTNVSDESRAQFLKRLSTDLKRSVRHYEHETKSAKEAA